MAKQKKDRSLAYGILVLIVLLLAILLMFYYKSQSNLGKEEFKLGKEVCGDMTKPNGNIIEVYPPLLKIMETTEHILGGDMPQDSYSGYWIKKINESITCQFPSKSCFSPNSESSFCLVTTLNLVVNYQDWKDWKNQEN